MSREFDNNIYCTLDGDFDEVMLVNFQNLKKISLSEINSIRSPEYCLNAVIENEQGYIKCPTKNATIVIKRYPVTRDVYESVLSALTFLDPGSAMCSECLYKSFASMEKEKIST